MVERLCTVAGFPRNTASFSSSAFAAAAAAPYALMRSDSMSSEAPPLPQQADISLSTNSASKILHSSASNVQC